MTRRADNAKGKTPPARDANAAARVQLALKLRAQRLTYEEIAQQAGYASRGAALNAVKRELQRRVATDVDAMRREEADSLDQLEKACWKRLEDTDYKSAMLFAVDRILAIKERRARLFGLDTPVDAAINPNLVVVREIPAGLLPSGETTV